MDCPIYGSGLGMDLVDYFDEISRKTKHIQFNRGIVKELKVRPLPRTLKPGEDPKQNALYIISSGMLVERTPSYTLASGLLGHAGNTIGFVGYCDPDTPGGRLLASKPGDTFLFETAHVKTKIKARVERFELSGHADREELLQFAVQTGARSIVLTHGDPPARAWFAQQLAVAPALGEGARSGPAPAVPRLSATGPAGERVSARTRGRPGAWPSAADPAT